MGNQMTAGHQSAATHWVIGIAMMIIAITFNKSNIIIIYYLPGQYNILFNKHS